MRAVTPTRTRSLPAAPQSGRPGGSHWGGLIGAIVLCQAAGLLGPLLSGGTGNTPWYRSLRKPAYTPPPKVFGPVWGVLYLLMGVAAHQLWQRRQAPQAKTALRAFGAQWLLNALWTPVFFGRKSVRGGLAVIFALWAAVVATQVRTWRVSRLGGLLLVPYTAWVSFATVLNAALARLNPPSQEESLSRGAAGLPPTERSAGAVPRSTSKVSYSRTIT